jgi:deoxyadenosine/deoxycytidine kinase
MVCITIDGNIGAGKSTILSFLNNIGKYDTHPEPVEDWEPFLLDMYKNDKDAFEFQVKVWTDRCFSPKYDPNKIICIERSPEFQMNVFTVANYENNKLNKRQYELLEELYCKPCYTPDLYIYLRTQPDKCIERIQKRNRNCESDIHFDYIKRIHDLHEITYDNLKGNKVVIDIEGKSLSYICQEVYTIIKQFNMV